MLYDFLLGVLASAMTGFALWAVLPRGAVLTRSVAEPDTWILRNDSPIPLKFTAVRHQGVDTMVETEDGYEFPWRDVPAETQHDLGLQLVPVEEQLYYDLTLSRGRWSGFVLPPGDSIRAMVNNNRTLQIKYRRAGWTGIFERREIMIYGGV